MEFRQKVEQAITELDYTKLQQLKDSNPNYDYLSSAIRSEDYDMIRYIVETSKTEEIEKSYWFVEAMINDVDVIGVINIVMSKNPSKINIKSNINWMELIIYDDSNLIMEIFHIPNMSKLIEFDNYQYALTLLFNDKIEIMEQLFSEGVVFDIGGELAQSNYLKGLIRNNDMEMIEFLWQMNFWPILDDLLYAIKFNHIDMAKLFAERIDFTEPFDEHNDRTWLQVLFEYNVPVDFIEYLLDEHDLFVVDNEVLHVNNKFTNNYITEFARLIKTMPDKYQYMDMLLSRDMGVLNYISYETFCKCLNMDIYKIYRKYYSCDYVYEMFGYNKPDVRDSKVYLAIVDEIKINDYLIEEIQDEEWLEEIKQYYYMVDDIIPTGNKLFLYHCSNGNLNDVIAMVKKCRK